MCNRMVVTKDILGQLLSKTHHYHKVSVIKHLVKGTFWNIRMSLFKILTRPQGFA